MGFTAFTHSMLRTVFLNTAMESGHPDSGFYIGQCNPCNAVIDNVISEHNALGYSGTNASDNIVIMNSIFRHNRLGVVPIALDSEELAPQGNITVVGNLVTDNGNEGDSSPQC